MRLPEFIIAGSPRCGTTWLAKLLACHPQIRLAKPIQPEPKFFLVDELYDKGLGYYSKKWFEGFDRNFVCGEKSTNYLENPIVAERIKECLPTVKLIFLLRNPITRAYSNYRWSVFNGLENEPFEVAIELEAKRERNIIPQYRYSRPNAYISRGMYAKQLSHYFSYFPKEQILVLQYEHIMLQPQTFSSKVHSFLNVDVRKSDWINLGRINSAPRYENELSKDSYLKLKNIYKGPNAVLQNTVAIDISLWE